jgi:endo-alpha-1,4-polygalactosaminidase (GH114 family)
MVAILAVAACASESEAAQRLPFIYHLQGANYESLKESNPRLAIVDADDSELSKKQLTTLRHEYGMQLYSYLSFGEVDLSRKDGLLGWNHSRPPKLIASITKATRDKRVTHEELHQIIRTHDALPEEQQWPSWLTDIWRQAYKINDANAPFNMEWNTLRVAYWRRDYQKMRIQQAHAMLKRGYDGIYLDTIDSYAPLAKLYTESSLRQKMVDSIAILKHTTQSKLIANNGMELYGLQESLSGQSRPYLSLISGQLKENTWYAPNGYLHDSQAPWREEDLKRLADAKSEKLPIYFVDYFKPGQTANIRDFLKKTRKWGKQSYGYAAPYQLDRVYAQNHHFYALVRPSIFQRQPAFTPPRDAEFSLSLVNQE